jgi:hypothetical protein
MKLLIVTLIFILLIHITYSIGQVKLYKLYDKTLNSDFVMDSSHLDVLNSSGAGFYLLNKVFRPKLGKFTVYRFICTYKGLSANTEKIETFHDLLILKTDRSKKIIDAYQYTLEWSEEPFTTDLYKERAKNLVLTNKLKLTQFQFFNVSDPGNTQQYSGPYKIMAI